MKDENPYMHVCTECKAKNSLIAGKRNEDPAKIENTIASSVHPTELKTTTGEVATKEKFKVVGTKDACCRKVASQIGVSGLEFHTEYNELLV